MILIRFLINFILFGVLFYLIWFFFPDAFNTLVAGARYIVELLTQLWDVAAEKIPSLKRELQEPIKSMITLILPV